MLICLLDLLVIVLLSVSFLTLLERKFLGSIQLRKGPNKAGFIGFLQPYSDGIKLFSKEVILILKSNYLYYLIRPIISILLILILWSNLPYYVNYIHNYIHILIILCLLRLGVYTLILAGWSSNSFYSLIGSLRSVAQTISYEVSIIFIIFSVIILVENFNLILYYKIQCYIWFIFIIFPVALILFVRFLAELNRTPFDFSEGESELVSGFNVEYIRGRFAIFFIAEYGIILFISYLFILLFIGGNYYSISFYFIYLIIVIIILWVRGTFPRFRYDHIIYIIWKRFLPCILCYLIFLARIKLLILRYL